jgi:regulator-associated protein of mTOR
MTAVAVQHEHGAPRQQYNPHRTGQSPNLASPSAQQSRPQTHTSSPANTSQRLENSVATNGINGVNGAFGAMNTRHTVSNDPVQPINGNGNGNGNAVGAAHPQANSGRMRVAMQNGESPAGAYAQNARPTTSAGVTADSSQDDSEPDRIARMPKPLLRRSRSDFGPRGGEEGDADAEDDIHDWGERHGFGTNYASEEYVSQLANVSRTFLFNFCFNLAI